MALLLALATAPACEPRRERERAPAPEPTGDAHADDLRHLTWLLREHWSWLEMREEQGVDLAALEAEALALAQAEPGDRGFLRGLRRYVSGLRDGHAFVALEGVDLREERHWPFSLVEVAEGLMVDGVDPATFASGALTRGDLVVAVDGVPIEELVREAEAFVFASTPGARRRLAIQELTESTTEESLSVRVLRGDASEPTTVDVPCPGRAAPVGRGSWRRFEQAYEDLDERTAYFCVGSFAARSDVWRTAPPEERDEILAAQYDELAAVMEKVVQKERLVLDLRGNPGGTDLLGQALALHLIEPDFRYFGLASDHDRWHRTSWIEAHAGRREPRFDGPIACLVDELTFSVADNFAACLRDEHPAVVFVGRPTGGGSGAPRPFTLPATGATVTFCTMRVRAPSGPPIEGHGVVPDVPVLPTRAQRLASEDVTLASALAELDRRWPR